MLFRDDLPPRLDQLLVLPGCIEVLPHEIEVGFRPTASIYLNTPVLSAAMDRVTEAQMAIALAREGGWATIHRNLSVEVDKVKRSQSGMIISGVPLLPRRIEQQATRAGFAGVICSCDLF